MRINGKTRSALVGLGLAMLSFAGSSGVLAEEAGDCEGMKWSLAAEQAAFQAEDLPKLASGAEEGALHETAFQLGLERKDKVELAVKPETYLVGDYAGTVRFAAPESPGLYQVTISSGGWIELVQDGKAIESSDHSGAPHCRGVKKSVRFEVEAKPVLLQLTGVVAPRINVAIRKVE
ncbi:hypothetical protein V6C03_10425 [Methyloligella sp. 2.7D]|uniref:hypothetical protein n=1 Tax=unclassified Methyloligella TaxID=2625955 RepID=UPI00157C9CD9|nr:hypothetical protein [Methyloligella sp. GL2]QKP77752.1 hypothetical protein HT051_10030 [Methyloligella sp. GL2]